MTDIICSSMTCEVKTITYLKIKHSKKHCNSAPDSMNLFRYETKRCLTGKSDISDEAKRLIFTRENINAE